MPLYDISLVIVNMNAADFLRQCLVSIIDTRGTLAVETIIVDNGSVDDSLAVAREVMPEAVILAQPENLGYVPANNIGLAVAQGRHVMFLNNDTLMHPGCLQYLVEFMDAHPDAGAVSGQILNPDGSDQGCARSFPTMMNGLFGRRSALTRWFPNNPWSRRFMVGRHHEGDEPFEVEILSAASMVLRTDLAKALAGMDEEFTLYWVCAELCHRVSAQGYGVWCVPASKIVHFEGHGGSTKTFRQRCRMTIAFNRDAYLAYVKVHGFGPLDPRRWLTGAALAGRAVLLMGLQLLQPQRATSSGGAN